MTARLRPVPTGVAAAAALSLALTGCGTGASSTMVVSGTVDATLTLVTAPTFRTPMVNLDAGFADVTGARDPVTGRTANTSSMVAGTLGFGSTVRVAEVSVVEGDTVKAGQALVNLDTSAQRAQLAAAKADADVAAAQVGLLADAIATTYDKEADVRDARAEVVDAIGKVRSGIATVKKKMAQGRAKLAEARRLLAQVNAQIAALPPGVPVPPDLQAVHDQLVAGITAGKAGLRKAAGILHQLRTGLKKATSGLRKIDDGLANIADARGSLRDLKELAELQAAALAVPVDVVRTQLALGRLTAPVDGVVVSVAHVGVQLAPAATVVSIRETRPSTVSAWLSPSQLDRVCTGDPATVTGDWMSGSGVRATLTRIAPSADYPPTSVATDEVHLTRAVEVEFTATEQLPAGVPVEVSIQGCHTAAGNTDPNR
jgi:multidrug efflux pump subunit AcrA (membrane-fusion protein)